MTNPFKEAWLMLRGIWACIDLIRHPDRLERVHDITNALARRYPNALDRLRARLSREDPGARALREQHRLRVNIDELLALPEGSLGKTFATHMRDNGLDHDTLPLTGDKVDTPQMARGNELRFIRAHIYDTHDVWHVVTGFGADVAGELGLQAFCAAQTPYALPSLLLGIGMLNTAFFALDDAGPRLEAIARGYRLGQHARPLFGVRWDELWAKPLADVRRDLNVAVPSGLRLDAA